MTIYLLLGVALFAVGVFALVAYASLLRKVMALNVMGSAIFLLLAAVAGRQPGTGPDPVPHAMVLTGIVVAVSVTAFALALVRRLHAETGSVTLPDDGERE